MKTSVDFDKVGFGVIIVARNDRDDINWRVDDLLRSKGYHQVTDNPCKNLNNRNVWYIDRDFDKVYHDLIIQQQNSLLRGS